MTSGKKCRQESSFLKKRSQKLSPIAAVTAFKPAPSEASETDKSFLVLFFKKELLAFFRFQ